MLELAQQEFPLSVARSCLRLPTIFLLGGKTCCAFDHTTWSDLGQEDKNEVPLPIMVLHLKLDNIIIWIQKPVICTTNWAFVLVHIILCESKL